MARRKRQQQGESPNYLAETLQDWRAKNGWPLKKVAAEFGVTESRWSRWESGERFPPRRYIARLAAFLGVPVCRFYNAPADPCPSCNRQRRTSAATTNMAACQNGKKPAENGLAMR
jgi:transcriptional regulator with XRE-family HTH domain